MKYRPRDVPPQMVLHSGRYKAGVCLGDEAASWESSVITKDGSYLRAEASEFMYIVADEFVRIPFGLPILLRMEISNQFDMLTRHDPIDEWVANNGIDSFARDSGSDIQVTETTVVVEGSFLATVNTSRQGMPGEPQSGDITFWDWNHGPLPDLAAVMPAIRGPFAQHNKGAFFGLRQEVLEALFERVE